MVTVLDGHNDERGFWDAAATTRAPLVVTHACAHALVPSARNLTDAQLDAVGESGGVIGVCFHHEDAGPRVLAQVQNAASSRASPTGSS